MKFAELVDKNRHLIAPTLTEAAPGACICAHLVSALRGRVTCPFGEIVGQRRQESRPGPSDSGMMPSAPAYEQGLSGYEGSSQGRLNANRRNRQASCGCSMPERCLQHECPRHRTHAAGAAALVAFHRKSRLQGLRFQQHVFAYKCRSHRAVVELAQHDWPNLFCLAQEEYRVLAYMFV